ncbi:unnamed protein product [Closterium sp. NIES-53]
MLYICSRCTFLPCPTGSFCTAHYAIALLPCPAQCAVALPCPNPSAVALSSAPACPLPRTLLALTARSPHAARTLPALPTRSPHCLRAALCRPRPHAHCLRTAGPSFAALRAALRVCLPCPAPPTCALPEPPAHCPARSLPCPALLGRQLAPCPAAGAAACCCCQPAALPALQPPSRAALLSRIAEPPLLPHLLLLLLLLLLPLLPLLPPLPLLLSLLLLLLWRLPLCSPLTPSVAREDVSLFEHTSGSLDAPADSADRVARSQWSSRNATATLADRNFTTVADLMTHLHSLDTRYCAALESDFLAANNPFMYLTLYFLMTHLHDSLHAVRDQFLALDPIKVTLVSFETRLLEAESAALAVAASYGTPLPSVFEGCSPSLLTPCIASAAAVDFLRAEEDVTASTPSGRRRSGKGKGGKGGGGGGGRGSGGGGGGGIGGGGGGGGGRSGHGGGGGSSGWWRGWGWLSGWSWRGLSWRFGYLYYCARWCSRWWRRL